MPTPNWRPMTAADLPAVLAVAGVVHPAYPEDEAVFVERLRLFPDGCLVLAGPDGLLGYVVSHPWRLGQPPALNSLLGGIPIDATSYYIHDLALRPEARGSGAAGRIIDRLVALARGESLASISLVAVNASLGFWEHHGFRVVHDAALAEKLGSYDDAACYLGRDLNG